MAEPLPAIVESLRRTGCVFAEDEARLLTDAAQSAEQLAAMVEQRVSGTPLEHLLGWVEFAGLRIAVDNGLFVPRRRTEVLVRETLNVIRPGGVVLELCCGVAAVAAAVAAESDGVEVHAADLDPAAVRCAVRNLASVGGKAYESDLFDSVPESLRGRVDVLVANAPYVPTDAIATMPPEAREYEPRESLNGGPDGVDLHRRVADAVGDWLAPGGHLIIETSERQAPLTVDAFTRNGLEAKVARAEDVDGTAVVGSVSR